jgi:hypothetical protein
MMYALVGIWAETDLGSYVIAVSRSELKLIKMMGTAELASRAADAELERRLKLGDENDQEFFNRCFHETTESFGLPICGGLKFEVVPIESKTPRMPTMSEMEEALRYEAERDANDTQRTLDMMRELGIKTPTVQ